MPFHKRWPQRLASILAIVSGALAFINYFFPPTRLDAPIQAMFKGLVLVSGGALLWASWHLVWRHWPQARQKAPGSMLLVSGFAAMFIAGWLPGGFQAGVGGWLYHWGLAPGMAAVFALLPIFLLHALMRHLSLRNVGGFLLFSGLILVLLGQIPNLTAHIPFLAIVRHDLLVGPAAAAFRGVLLGIALAVILAMFRPSAS